MKFLCTWTLVLTPWLLSGQGLSKKVVSVDFESVTRTDALTQLTNMASVNIAFSPNFFDTARISASFRNRSVPHIISQLLKDTDADYQVRKGRILITKKPHRKGRLYGHIRDDGQGDGLAFATLYFPDLGIGTSTNDVGYFSIYLPMGQHRMAASYVGRAEHVETVDVSGDARKDISLADKPPTLEVIITPEVVQGATAMNQTYRRKALTDLAMHAPGVSGESDVLQTVRSIPGVQSNAGEIGGYFVRGGNSDQNLILMDGVALYYPSHMLGIYSVFNSESVNSIQVFKSGFPARYGGRLSSVIDILTRNGNQDNWEGEAALSLQSLRVSLQGPLSKKGSIMLGARHSLATPFVNEVLGESFFRVPGEHVGSRYHDIHFKMNHRLGQHDHLLLNFYSGRDEIDLDDVEFSEDVFLSSRNSWGNSVASIQYHRELGHQSFLKVMQSFNHFSTEFLQLQEFDDLFEEDDESQEFLFQAGVSNNIDIESKISLDRYFSPSVSGRLGGGIIKHRFTPSLEAQDESEFNRLDSSNLDFNFFSVTKEGTFLATSKYLYGELDWRWSRKWFANLGLRWSHFKNEEAHFHHFEPRLQLQYAINDQALVQVSSSKMVQYLHQIANADLALPKDIWLPTDDFLLPAVAWHHNVAYSLRSNKGFALKLEGYLKRMKNLVLVFSLEDISLVNASFLENASIGRGRSVGLEGTFEMPFKKGSLTSSLAWSKSERNFMGINADRVYPFQFDRRVEWKSLISYELAPKLRLGSRLYASSAHPEFLVEDGSVFFDLSPLDLSLGQDKNGARAFPQFRWDLSASYYFSKGSTSHNIKLNLYNVLNLRNAGFTYLGHSTGRLHRTDVFSMPFIPSLQYSISF